MHPTIDEVLEKQPEEHRAFTAENTRPRLTPQRSPRVLLLEALAAAVVGMDQCCDDYSMLCKALWSLLYPGEHETLHALVTHGPVWDGDIPSKASRDHLMQMGLASRACMKGETGYAVANYRGYDVWKQGQP